MDPTPTVRMRDEEDNVFTVNPDRIKYHKDRGLKLVKKEKQKLNESTSEDKAVIDKLIVEAETSETPFEDVVATNSVPVDDALPIEEQIDQTEQVEDGIIEPVQ